MTPNKKLIRKLIALTCIASFILAFSACKKDGSVTIAKEDQLTQTAYADETTTGSGFTFTSTGGGWRLFVKEGGEYSEVSWMHLVMDGDNIYPPTGNERGGTHTIVVNLDINYTGKSRSASIEIESIIGSDKITISVTQYGTTKDGEIPYNGYRIIASNIINGNSNITDVGAWVSSTDGWYNGIGFTTYENNGFSLEVFEYLPDEYLHSAISEWFPQSVLNNPSANFNSIRIWAQNNEGQFIGEFCQCDSGFDSWYEYVYADRDFTAIGNVDNVVYDCSIKKGWNIIYLVGKTKEFLYTTQKPSNINFEWHFYEQIEWHFYEQKKKK
jgi:hypothetical protein